MPAETKTTPAAPPAIQVQHLIARYEDRTILDGVSFEVRRGERFFIVGGSGCGKTTLLRHIIGLNRPWSGRVLINGADIASADEDELRRIQRNFGMLFQSGALFGSLTLGENVALLLEEYTSLPRETIDLLVRIKLSMVKLAGFEDFMIAELSGGMKKRAALARAVALDPSILFFDEPSAGLDPVTSAGLDELIIQVNRSLGTTIVVVSHELPSIFTVADRVIMLDGEAKGIVAQGKPLELRAGHPDPRVHAFFNRQPGAAHRRTNDGNRSA
ncbi:MAG TPA: ATP-binding cassette domain-containing protein [Candidatus Margulisiibacteriota bacterium]|nr:ATP-binding cassette domain-containing protein [Candidatus Margulisiibacteriota bacterium]